MAKAQAASVTTETKQVTGQTVELPEAKNAEFMPGVDTGSYDEEREADPFRGNENNRRVAERLALKGDVGLKPDAQRLEEVRKTKLVETDTVILGNNSSGPSPNAPATLTENPAGTTIDPEGLTQRAGNGGGANGGVGGWTRNV